MNHDDFMKLTKELYEATKNDTIYSNFNHELNKDAVALAMKDGEQRDHAAQNFFGYIKYDLNRQIWIEEVWRYGCRIDTFENGDVASLIRNVNERFGDE